MRVIDLLNKIANEEEVPKKIVYNDIVFTLNEYNLYFAPNENDRLLDYINYNFSNINDEVKVLEEDKKYHFAGKDYTLEELDRPGEFNPEKALELKVPRGPLWGKLQKGESVINLDGNTVEPEQVVGKPRSGRKFSFVTDTLYLPGIANEVKGSDLLICEGMFARDCAEQAKEKKHMTSTQAATIAKNANVKRMALIH